MGAVASGPVVRFGLFEANVQSGELRRQGLKIRLQDQPFQILAMLLEHPGELVTRDQIQKKLWPADTFVDFDHGLNNAINRLREARNICHATQSPDDRFDTGRTTRRTAVRPLGGHGDAHRRRFDAVVVWEFDCFARSVSHLLRALETFRALGIEFVSLSEQVDTSTPMGKMVFTVLGAVAELERSLIVERVKAGLRNAHAKGRRLGRPRVPVSSGKIQELRAEGLTLRDIATRCRVSKTTVIRALK